MAILHVGWALLNLVLFVVALFLLRPLLKRYGRLQVGFSLAVLVVMCQSANKRSFHKSKSESFQAVGFIPALPDNKLRSHYLTLVDLTTCSVGQDVYVTRKGQSDSIQIDSYVTMTGWSSGFSGSPLGTQVRVQLGRWIHYSTVGTLDWRLFGLPVYKQPKQFDGCTKL